MAFIVEDGTGVTDANSYQTVDAFREYWTDRGVTFTVLDSKIESWLILSTDYADENNSFIGYQVDTDQSLEWPRYNAKDKKGKLWDSDVLPKWLLYGINELASLLKNEPTLEPDITASSTGVTSKRVGPFSTNFGSNAALRQEPLYRKAMKYFRIITDNSVVVL